MEITNSNVLDVTSYWRYQPPAYTGFPYDPEKCNRNPLPNELGIVRVHDNVISFDDPKNPGKVCMVDGTELFLGLTPGMYSVQVGQVGWDASNVNGPSYTARHTSYPFPGGGFVPTAPMAPESDGIVAPGQPQAYNMIGLGPFTVSWGYDPAISGVTYKVYVDGVVVTPVAIPDQSLDFSVSGFGVHQVEITAIVDGVESLRTPQNHLEFVNASSTGIITPPGPIVISDPSCLAPLGAHAPAIFITSMETTTGRPGSRSRLNFQIAGADPIQILAVQLDGIDTSIIQGANLNATGGVWFAQPAVGTHTVNVRVVNSFGCQLIRTFDRPLIVRP